MTYFPGCMNVNPEVLCGYQVQDVLVAYVLEVWSSYQQLSRESQIQLRFSLTIFVQGMITAGQITAICHQFHPHVGSATQILATAMTSPETFGACGRTYHWSNSEDMMLLVGSLWGHSSTLSLLSSRRPQETWSTRMGLIVRQLENAGALARRPAPDSCREIHVLPSISIEQEMPSPCPCPNRRRLARVRHALTMTEKRQLKRECVRLKARLMSKEKRVKQLQNSIARMNLALEEEEPNEALSFTDEALAPLVDTELQTKFLEEMHQLSLIASRQRTYSTFVLEIAELLALTSRKTYRLLRQMLPLPCESCLRYHFGEMLRETKLLLTSEESVGTHIDKVVADDKDAADIVTIGIDAFAFRTFHDKTTFKASGDQEGHSNAFVFLHIPLNADAPVKVISLKSQANGAFNSKISDMFQMIAKEYSRLNINIWFKSTDGDRFLNTEHNLFYENYVKNYRGNFHLLLQHIHDKLIAREVIVPIADPLHFAKNLRGKLIDHPIAVVNEETLHFVTRDEVQSVLGVGQALDDRSQIGRMRDVYVTRLFTLQNVVRLMNAGCFSAAFLLLPYACLFTVMYCDNLTIRDRMFLVHLSYICFDIMLEENSAIVRDHQEVQHRFLKPCKGITPAEPSYIRRMIHTCLSFGISMVFGPGHVRLDALGTHLVENAIGIARCVSNSSDYSRIVSAFANAEIRKRLARKWNITLHIPKRITDGGAKINTIQSEEIGIIPEDWDPRDIVSIMREACISELREQVRAEYEQLSQALEDVVSKIRLKKLSCPSEVANTSIISRNYAYNSH